MKIEIDTDTDRLEEDNVYHIGKANGKGQSLQADIVVTPRGSYIEYNMKIPVSGTTKDIEDFIRKSKSIAYTKVFDAENRRKDEETPYYFSGPVKGISDYRERQFKS